MKPAHPVGPATPNPGPAGPARDARASGITIVGASAGSGKTYRLTREVTAAIAPPLSAATPATPASSASSASSALSAPVERIDVGALVAVTFTRKAHAELEARIRHALAREGAHAEALRIPLAYLGTVHAVALRLLSEFAIDAGLSPNVDVVAGSETRLLRQAFERTLGEEERVRLDELAARLELGIDHRVHRTDWVTPCADIMDLARSNRVAPDALPAMAERSIAGLHALLPPPVGDAAALDLALARELERSAALLAEHDDGTKATAEARDAVRKATVQLRDGALPWSAWAKLASLSAAKKCDPFMSDLRLAAARYEEHPRLRDDLAATTRAVFAAAQAGLVAYQDWKRERRVIDYVDMLHGALDLVEAPRVRAELARRLRFVVVDEFQDTSPIQLALFVRLHALAGRSVWVGDRKQCIFEYAGADPALMDAVTDWVAREGGARDRLEHNHRSRPALVALSSELFAAALGPHGFERADVAVEPRRPEPAALAILPPLGLWLLESKSVSSDAEAVAEGVRRLLDAPHATPVIDRTTGAPRPLRPGDIAVLTATNDWASALADALHARGLRSAIARAGLLETPEGTLADAALRWLLDPTDALSAATLDALTGWASTDPDTWLASRLREIGGDAGDAGDASVTRDARDARDAADPGDAADEGWRADLAGLRERLAILSPSEALDGVVAALDLVRCCARWPDPSQRIANLDALRALAQSYEDRSAQEREAATVSGLLRYFDDLRSPVRQRDELLRADDQHVPVDDGAVAVCTYHKAKGLEWPVVVLANLERAERRTPFEVTPESTSDAPFDPEDPLAHRAIRYWPWPLGAARSSPLADRADASAEGRAVTLRELRERVRLLYVGFTRARDHLILAVRANAGASPKCRAWLDTLADAEGAPLLDLPLDAEDGAIADTAVAVTVAVTDTVARGAESARLRTPTRVHRLDPERRPRDRVDEPAPRWFARPLASSHASDARPPYRIVPSAEITDWPEHAALVARARVGEVERFPSGGLRLDAPTQAYDLLGSAIHAFLAADVEGLPHAERHARAARLLSGWGVTSTLRPEPLLQAGDAMRAWITRRWPGARWRREIPIEGRVSSAHGDRRLGGIIDLLLETDDGFVLIDHKSFPAPHTAAWRAKCETFLPQLSAYALLLAERGPVIGAWIHLPVGGGAVACELPPADGWRGEPR